MMTPFSKPGEFCNHLETDYKAMSLINTINTYRKKKGLKEIKPDDNLCNVAFLHGYDQFVSIRNMCRNNI